VVLTIVLAIVLAVVLTLVLIPVLATIQGVPINRSSLFLRSIGWMSLVLLGNH
jgi:hypothetical protein